MFPYNYRRINEVDLKRYHEALASLAVDMSYYHPSPYRGYPGYYDRYSVPHPEHPYDKLFYGSRWYDYPPSLYHSRDYMFRMPSVTGLPYSKFRSGMDYGYSYPYGSHVSPHDLYGLTEPRYNMLFNDELKVLPKYSKYGKYPLVAAGYDPTLEPYKLKPVKPLRNYQIRLGSTTASFSSDGKKVKMYY